MAPTEPLKVIVIGAGIAGLLACRILSLQGHHVTIYERGTLDNATGGQGIHFAAVAVRMLSNMGFDPARARAVVTNGFRIVDKNGEIIADSTFSADSWTGLRADMRDEMVRLVTGQEGGLAGVEIETNCAVVDVDPMQGTVTLASGEVRHADLIISWSRKPLIGLVITNRTTVADGIHSRLRKYILGSHNHFPKKTGDTIYRVAIPIETTRQLCNNDIPAWCLPNKDGKGSSALFQPLDGSHRMVVSYPCRNFEYMNISCVLRSRPGQEGGENWFDDADRLEVAEAFQDFPQIVALMRATNLQAKVWDMQDLDPLPFWHRGKAIVIGDAAHAMTPMMGIGANLAVEDAEAFTLMQDANPEDVVGILGKIESVRRPRTVQVLAINRTMGAETGLEERSARMEEVLMYKGIREELQRQYTSA